MTSATVTRIQPLRLTALALVLGALAGCEEGQGGLAFLQPGDKAESAGAADGKGKSTKLVERDVEAPEVFEVTEAGLWDGRPSLGGVWVAHPDATDPERVIIRNSTNDKFVIGALFRREREIPGPRIQASSDAADALGMLAGAPVQLQVTVLRRETVEQTPPEDELTVQTAALETEEISESALDPIAGAAAAIDASAPDAATPEAETPVAAPQVAAAAPTRPRASSLGKPYIQIGIFSVQSNANRTADLMRSEGMVPTVFEQESNGKAFWRVVVGPASNSSERSTLLEKVKEAGFSDAYAVGS